MSSWVQALVFSIGIHAVALTVITLPAVTSGGSSQSGIISVELASSISSSGKENGAVAPAAESDSPESSPSEISQRQQSLASVHASVSESNTLSDLARLRLQNQSDQILRRARSKALADAVGDQHSSTNASQPKGLEDYHQAITSGDALASDATSGSGTNPGAEGGAFVSSVAVASYFSNPAPIYPSRARALKQEGLVKLLVSVDVRGMAKDVSVAESSGHSLLDDAALEAVRNWRFRPASVNGRPVEAQVSVPLRFELRK